MIQDPAPDSKGTVRAMDDKVGEAESLRDGQVDEADAHASVQRRIVHQERLLPSLLD